MGQPKASNKTGGLRPKRGNPAVVPASRSTERSRLKSRKSNSTPAGNTRRRRLAGSITRKASKTAEPDKAPRIAPGPDMGKEPPAKTSAKPVKL